MRLDPNRLPSECFDFKVSGIPCIVCVTHYEPDVPANLSGHPDTWDPPEPGEFEYELYDRKGYRAKWLEDKVREDEFFSMWKKFEDRRTM